MCMDRRTKLKQVEQALLRKLQRGVWTAAELQWLENHLRPGAPTVLITEVRHRLQMRRNHGRLGLMKVRDCL
jgi:hypothetical protein